MRGDHSRFSLPLGPSWLPASARPTSFSFAPPVIFTESGPVSRKARTDASGLLSIKKAAAPRVFPPGFLLVRFGTLLKGRELVTPAHRKKRRSSMRSARISDYAMLCSLLSVVWFTSGLAWANEVPSVKPEPEVVPAPPKPHGAVNDTKPPGKGAPPARTGAARKPVGVPHLPPSMVGKDGAPMVLVS